MSVKAWTPEEESNLIKMYSTETKDVYKIGEFFNKGHRSVISKLVQLKIYEKPDAKKTPKDRTVKMMLNDLEKILEIQIEGTNLNLLNLVEAIEKLMKDNS